MLRTALKNAITLERERERESNLSKNIATGVAWFVMPKTYMLKRKQVSYV